MTTAAEVQAIASCFHTLKPDTLLLEQWAGMLTSGHFKFGYGVLRSGDDEFDAFGVLASMAPHDWVWDAEAEAWGILGRTEELDLVTIAECLGIKLTTKLDYTTMQRFQEIVTQENDTCHSFHGIAQLLLNGHKRMEQERRRLKDMPRFMDSYRNHSDYIGGRY